MKAIITGRIFDANKLVAYKVWFTTEKQFVCRVVSKDNIKILFKEHDVLNCKYTDRVESNISIKTTEYPRYNKNMKLVSKNRYTDSSVIAITLKYPVEQIRMLVCGALVSGAIKDPLSMEGIRHAEMYYEEIRHMSTDVRRIAQNTGFDEKQIHAIKNYLFMESHELSTGFRRFDASLEIAQSWQRLMSKNKRDIKKHDITLLRHELMEMQLIQSGLNQETAHNYAQNEYNYAEEANEYYAKIEKH